MDGYVMFTNRLKKWQKKLTPSITKGLTCADNSSRVVYDVSEGLSAKNRELLCQICDPWLSPFFFFFFFLLEWNSRTNRKPGNIH